MRKKKTVNTKGLKTVHKLLLFYVLLKENFCSEVLRAMGDSAASLDILTTESLLGGMRSFGRSNSRASSKLLTLERTPPACSL